ncbi:hypothetical protein OHS33_29860 [Streptomyces sp. NBC_00536]|uniref:hypothetical protein n=1 Tax=Streptomyces sp. NBC_00536 TaxID=2975769 RepID=UPI002E82487D|nr:hypothetical protein [Streptomyces sp. NBC_00536]WUC82184.1 hypothetical protein OHS33_29860 [Streptomyces sp. NBC_00536]
MSATLLTARAPRLPLRPLLALDAVVTGANGLAYALLAGPLGRLLGVGRTPLLVLGVMLAGYGAAVGALAARRQPAAALVMAVIEINCAWVALSLLSLFLWFEPTTAGLVWIPAQAAVVAAFAVLQWAARGSRGQ